MWSHFKSYSLKDKEIFNGFTDYHSHILPGVDDGIESIDSSLKVLSFYEKLGIREVWLTPHIMEDIPNTTEHLRSRYQELKTDYRGKIILHLASENMLDNLFIERFEKDDVLPLLDNNYKYLLVETSYFNPPMNFFEILEKIKSKGYYPVLAHPERYIYLKWKDYLRLKKMKIYFQLNIASLTKYSTKDAQHKAKKLLLNNMYNCTGSDLHLLSDFNSEINFKIRNQKLLNAAEDLSKKQIIRIT